MEISSGKQQELFNKYYEHDRHIESTEFEERFLVKDTRNDTIKLIRKINTKDAQKLERILKETIVAKRIKLEKSLQGVIDYFIENKQLYIVQEYLDEKNRLYNYCKNNSNFQKDTIISWCLELAFIVDYLHIHDLAHGNITLNNVYINNENHIVLGQIAFTDSNVSKCKKADILSLEYVIKELETEFKGLNSNYSFIEKLNFEDARSLLKSIIKTKNSINFL